jgi:hypothetical protein
MKSPSPNPAAVPLTPALAPDVSDPWQSFWVVIPILAVIAAEAVYGWPLAKLKEPQHAVAYFAGHLFGSLLVPLLIGWIVYRLSRRSEVAAAIAVSAVIVLECIGLMTSSLALRSSNPTLQPTATRAPNVGSDQVAIVQNDVRCLQSAVFTGDVDTVLGYTNPKIIQLVGGTAKVRASLVEVTQQFQSAGMRIESSFFPEPPTFIKGAEHEFVVVPTLTIMTAGGQRVEARNYQFGIRNLGEANWTYVEGGELSAEKVNALFPDFPADFKLPQTEIKKL